MARLAIIAALLAVIVLLFRSFLRSDPYAAPSTEMVQDPSCGTFVPKPEAVFRKVGDRDCYFCSQKCADEYQSRNAHNSAS